jgi:alpha-mannosidase
LRSASALFQLKGLQHDTVDLDRAWKDHVYIDHGFGGLHGVGTDEIFRHKAESALHVGLGAIETGLASLAEAIDLSRDELVVYNPLARTRSDWVEVEIQTDAELSGIVTLKGPDGVAVTGQVVSQASPVGVKSGTATLGFVAPDIPGLGYAVFGISSRTEPQYGPSLPDPAGDFVFSNDHYTAVVTRGGMTRLVDARTDLPVARTDAYLFGEMIALESPGIDVGQHEQDGSWDYTLPRPYQPRIIDFEKTGHRGTDPRVAFHTEAVARVVTEAPIAGALARNTYTFYRDLPYVDLRVDLVGWSGEHARELRVCFPFAGNEAASRVRYEVPFGHVTVGEDEIEDFADMRPREVQNWIQASDADRALTVSGSVAVYDWLDVEQEAGGIVLQAILLATKRSCHSQGNWYDQPGDHTAYFRIDPTQGSSATELGWGRAMPMRARGGLLAAAQGLRSDERVMRSAAGWVVPDVPNVLLTCMKPLGAYAVLIRYWEHEGRNTTVRLAGLPEDVSLLVADPFGANGVVLDGNSIEIPAHGLVTVVAHRPRAWRSQS